MIGYKGGINAIRPGGGAHLAAEVIDLLQELGLLLLRSKKREINFPPQMENKLHFKHVNREENEE